MAIDTKSLSQLIAEFCKLQTYDNLEKEFYRAISNVLLPSL